MLRRTWATIAHQAGVSPKTAQAQLRHASLNTTMDTYTQSVRIDMVDAVEKMAALVES
jgi:integrase